MTKPTSSLVLVLVAALLAVRGAEAAADHCAVCGEELRGKVYVLTDKATGEKKQVCSDCSVLAEACFICGLPVKKDYVKLPDGRFLCARDAKTAVLDEDEAKNVYAEVKEALERLFARFLKLPQTNVDMAIVDRVHLQELFKYPGRDYECPNVLGYIQTRTNHGQLRHQISLLGALPRAEFKAVCAHELAHAWQFENVPARRKSTLGRDAKEAFCELTAYLLMDSQREEEQKAAILRNAYTRGQIDLFIEAEARFGFNEVLDWMKYGSDSLLHGEDLNRIRTIEVPKATAVPMPLPNHPLVAAPAAAPEVLVLRSITWSQNRPLAMINNRILGINEEGRVKLGQTNVMVRCLEIRTNSVLIQVRGAAAQEQLFLPDP